MAQLDTRIPMQVPNVLAQQAQVTQNNRLAAQSLGEGFNAVQRGMAAPLLREGQALQNEAGSMENMAREQQLLGGVLQGLAEINGDAQGITPQAQAAWAQARGYLVQNGVFNDGELPEALDMETFQGLSTIATMPTQELTDWQRKMQYLTPEEQRSAARINVGIDPRAQAESGYTLRPGDTRMNPDGSVAASVPAAPQEIKPWEDANGNVWDLNTGQIVPNMKAPTAEKSPIAGLEARAEAAGLVPGSPEYQQFMLNNGQVQPEKLTPLQQRALDGGLTPGSPEYQEFMLNGGIPKASKPPKELEIAQFLFPDDIEAQREFVSKNPGGVNVTVGDSNIKLTESQSKDLNFYVRGLYAANALEPIDKALVSLDESLMSEFKTIGNLYASPEYRRAKIAADEFLAIVLRKDTGAAITDQEFDTYGPIYLPMPGDDDAALEMKRQMRGRIIGTIRLGLGTATPLADDVDARFAGEMNNKPVAGTGVRKTGVPKGHRFTTPDGRLMEKGDNGWFEVTQ